MGMLKVGAVICAIAGVLLIIGAFAIPAAKVGLMIGGIALLVAAVVNWVAANFFGGLMADVGIAKKDQGFIGLAKMTKGQMATGAAKTASAVETMKQMNRAQSLQMSGENAEVQVLDVRDTGQLINFDPIFEFDLLIDKGNGQPPYPLNGHRQIVSKVMVGRVAAGNKYPAKVDPADPNEVHINWS